MQITLTEQQADFLVDWIHASAADAGGLISHDTEVALSDIVKAIRGQDYDPEIVIDRRTAQRHGRRRKKR